jgi:hypothetical protein
MPKMFWKVVANKYVEWFANQVAWMTLGVFESRMMNLYKILNIQKQKVFLTMDKNVTRSF